MPIVRIYGLVDPDNMMVAAISDTEKSNASEYANLVTALPVLLRPLVASVRELKITADMVSVFLPSDLSSEGLGEEIVVLIDLDDKPERDLAVQKGLADVVTHRVGEWFKPCLPQLQLVETCVRPVKGGHAELRYEET